MRDASSDISPSATFRFRAASSVTPEASPTSTRRDAPAGQSRSPLNGNKALLSPGAAAHDLASLSQVNYALTLQLSDLHAGVEGTGRTEGLLRLLMAACEGSGAIGVEEGGVSSSSNVDRPLAPRRLLLARGGRAAGAGRG